MSDQEEGVYRHPAVPCPMCGHTLDAVGSKDGSDQGDIAPGDYSVCIACACVLEYTALGGYRVPSDAEWEALPRDLRVELVEVAQRIKALPREDTP